MKRPGLNDIFAGAMAAGVLVTAGGAAYGKTAKKPNIVFLLADDQCKYSVGCYGNNDVKTPNMDKLGSDGVIFDRHYDTTSICMASRANIFTGMYEYKTGTNFGYSGLTEEKFTKSYPFLLRQAGYFTAFAGKFGIGKPLEHTGEKYFDMWGGSPGQTSYKTASNKSMKKYAATYPHSTLSYGAFGQDVIKEAVKQNKPFCLSISFKAPHRPTTPDPKFDDVYAGKKLTKPANFGREYSKHFAEQSKKGRQYERFESWGYSTKYDEVMRTYYQQSYGIDVAIGMIRDELDRQKVADNTVIIYTSDNGFLCGSHGYGSKVLAYEESSSVPLMIYDPRHPVSGKKLRCDAVTGNIDFAPTILALAGLPIEPNMDGKSLLPLLDDPKGKVRDSLVLMNVWGPSPTHHMAVVTSQWKYTYWWHCGDGMQVTEELFNMKSDRLELVNCAVNPEYSQALKAMRATYDTHLNHWKEHCEEEYGRYKTLFDRSVPWDQKENLVARKKEKKPKNKKKRKKDK